MKVNVVKLLVLDYSIGQLIIVSVVMSIVAIAEGDQVTVHTLCCQVHVYYFAKKRHIFKSYL
jgi:hypothetical protein